MAAAVPGAADETVRAILDDHAAAEYLAAIYAEEVVPGFALGGIGWKAQRYVAAFLNWASEPDPSFVAPRLGAIL